MAGFMLCKHLGISRPQCPPARSEPRARRFPRTVTPPHAPARPTLQSERETLLYVRDAHTKIYNPWSWSASFGAILVAASRAMSTARLDLRAIASRRIASPPHAKPRVNGRTSGNAGEASCPWRTRRGARSLLPQVPPPPSSRPRLLSLRHVHVTPVAIAVP